jgi:gas vesicle protein
VQPVQAASPQSPALTPEQQRAQRLRDEAAQLDDLAQQLQHEMRKAGDDKLSLQAVRLAQQIQGLSKQIQAELRQP